MFYHLTRSGPAATLQVLLPRAMAAGWRVMIRGGDIAALEQLDQQLWLEPEDGFLPHGLQGGPYDADQPVLLGQGAAMNGAQAVVLIDGAEIAADEARGLERVWAIFDGADEDAVAQARGLWTRLVAGGVSAQYWSEETGRWEKKAEKLAV
ncbi:MAG: DNA polymerase III subunit chi [Paracoccaceae bacterium]